MCGYGKAVAGHLTVSLSTTHEPKIPGLQFKAFLPGTQEAVPTASSDNLSSGRVLAELVARGGVNVENNLLTGRFIEDYEDILTREKK